MEKKKKVAWNKGKKLSECFSIEKVNQIKEKLSKRALGRISPRKGKKNSLESRKKMSESHKGKVAWNKGKKHSQETIEKIKKSKSNISKEIRKKISEYRKGKVAWNKGLTKETSASVKKYAISQSKTKHSKEWKKSDSYKNLLTSLRNPERCRKISIGRQKYWSNPNNNEKKIKQIEKMKYSLINSERIKKLDNASKPELLFIILLERNNIQYEFQKSIDNRFVCDFYIIKQNLIIEINGYWHTKKDRIEKDNYRKKELKKLGYNVKIIDVKIKNEELFKKVIESIK